MAPSPNLRSAGNLLHELRRAQRCEYGVLLCVPNKKFHGITGEWRGSVMVGGHRMVNVWFNAEQAGLIADEIERGESDEGDDRPAV